MKKIIISLLPTALALFYGACELIIYAITGQVYFSSVFAWELMVYLVLSLAYIYWVFRTVHSALRVAVYGTIIGAAIFFFVGSLIFLKFDTFFECGQEKIIERNSADRRYMIIEYVENCGAVSDFETVFEIKNQISKEKQQILNLKGDRVDECESSWVDDKTLLIECVGNKSTQIYSFQNGFEEVKINFKLPDSFFLYDYPNPRL